MSQLLQKNKNLKLEVYEKDQLLEASNKTLKMLIEGAENDMATINNLQDQISKMTAFQEAEKARHLEVKRRLYDDFVKENKQIKKTYMRFRGLSQLELRVKEEIVNKVKTDMDRMTVELKSLKTVLEIPRLRDELRHHDFREIDFKTFLKELE